MQTRIHNITVSGKTNQKPEFSEEMSSLPTTVRMRQ